MLKENKRIGQAAARENFKEISLAPDTSFERRAPWLKDAETVELLEEQEIMQKKSTWSGNCQSRRSESQSWSQQGN